MTLKTLKPFAFSFLVFILPIAILLNSCKKIDRQGSYTKSTIDKFLALPTNASPQLIRIIEDLKKKERENPFIVEFANKIGFPQWEFAKVQKDKRNSNALARELEENEIAEIPVVLNTEKFVNAILSVKLDTEPLYKLFKSEDWETYGFDKDNNRLEPNADDLVGKIMAYEKEIWSEQFFKVYDNRLFDYWPDGSSKRLSFVVAPKVIDGIIVNIDIVCEYEQIPILGPDRTEITPCPPTAEHCFELSPIPCNAVGWIISIDNPLGGVAGWVSAPSELSNPGAGPSGGGAPGGSSNGPCRRTM